MKERIRAIMEAENMTSARFADKLKIGPAVISHILKGRNNPSLDVITQILTEMPYINSDWLITGNGNMYKSGMDKIAPPPTSFNEKQATSSPDLFRQDLFHTQNPVNTQPQPIENEYRKENELSNPQNGIQTIVNERIVYKERPDKKIVRIIVYYSDTTYEVFETDK
ncbi:helix-turn-helix domain-containing protein [Viscerimonas tarda]